MNENIERFEDLMSTVNRDGVDKLMAYIRKSDFYTAPASTKYHSCHEGGLLEHSLNVYDCLMNKKDNAVWGDILKEVGDESLTIVSLLHDICKTYYYVVEMKNKKIYKPDGKKVDGNGRFDWETVPGYTCDDRYPMGHGEKSIFMIEEYMKLKPIERYAIRWHMGFSEPKEQWGTLQAAIKRCPLVLAIHEADLEATYLLEKEE